MRTIKFRAWDTVENKMLKSSDALTFNESGNKKDAGWCFSAHKDGKIKIMQYTGLKDKNGKEIYENDVVKYEKESMIDGKITECFGVVEMLEYPDGEAFYDQKHLGWCATGKEGTKTLPDIAEYSEVIGNTYENPNLI